MDTAKGSFQRIEYLAGILKAPIMSCLNARVVHSDLAALNWGSRLANHATLTRKHWRQTILARAAPGGRAHGRECKLPVGRDDSSVELTVAPESPGKSRP